MEHSVTYFFQQVFDAFVEKNIEKLTFSKPRKSATETDLRNVYARGVTIKDVWQWQLTYRYATRDEFKNFTNQDIPAVFAALLKNEFQNADLITPSIDWNIAVGKKVFLKKNVKKNNEKMPQKTSDTGGGHNLEKKRHIAPNAPYLHALEISTIDGIVTPTGQKKYKQINKYIEILDSVLREKPLGNAPNIVDMGSGKGYLTFALYDFLTQQNAQPHITGIELRPNLVDFCNNLSQKIKYENLKFESKDINEFEGKIDLLIALHACDTATDIALAKGIEAQAEVVVVAPCCHKQIRKSMTQSGIFEPMLKHGILKERMAEMLTDTIRALILEENGYATKVFEFVSLEHTAKNVMIVGIKNQKKSATQARNAREKIENLKQQFGIDFHFLDTILVKN